MKYIDVSEHQGIIEWEKVKDQIDGAIIRAGYSSKGTPDKRFTYNVSECNRLGIPCGAYWFSYAKNMTEAKAEAKHLLAAVKPYKMELPMCYDFEYHSVENAEAQGVKITKELATAFAVAFCSEVEAAGYWVLNYSNTDYLNRMYDMDSLGRFGLWLAAWKLSQNPDLSNPPRSCSIWQWTNTGRVSGINGNVDVNESYIDFPQAIRKSGLNHLQNIDPAQDALKWAQSLYITDDPALALALYRYHNTFNVPEDVQRYSGKIAD
jgi:GH25 family lysozyme M1 (1,4-beta-N-acetylmuramidase)